MPNGEPPGRYARDVLLVIGVLAVSVGFGAITSGVLEAEPVVSPDGAQSSRQAGIASPTLPDGDRCAGVCLGHSVARGGQDAPPVARRDAPAASPAVTRDYLAHMTAMVRRRFPRTGATPDPYQMSLNPRVYLTGTATPIGGDRAAKT
jgi:hypothetical protein